MTKYWPKIPPEPPPMASVNSPINQLPMSHPFLSKRHYYWYDPNCNEPHHESHYEPNQPASGKTFVNQQSPSPPPYVIQLESKPSIVNQLTSDKLSTN